MAAAKKILIAEDEVSLRQIMVDTLTDEGYEVIAATDGKEGVQLFQEQTPDLILLDIMMPNMDGIEMMKEVRKLPGGPQIPVIMLTNLSPTDDKMFDAIVQDEPTFYIVKSDLEIDELVDKVKRALAGEAKSENPPTP